MRTTVSFLATVTAAWLLSTSLGGVGYGQSQSQRPNCDDVNSICLQSEAPVPGVRIVRQQDYPKRPATYLSSNLYTTLAGDRETGRRFCAFDFQVTPNGGGPDAHHHRNEWETFFVEQGSMTFVIGVDASNNFITHEVPAGTVVYGPQGPVHGFKDFGSQPARIFSFAMPCGLDYFFYTSGTPVAKFDAPIPGINIEEIVRTAFWAEQRGDALQFPNTPPPSVPPDTPRGVISSINPQSKDFYESNGQLEERPKVTEPGLFGETRIVLLTEKEVGHTTGATAFCGPGQTDPRSQGGSVGYSYFTMPAQREMPTPTPQPNTEVFYTQGGILTFAFTDPEDYSQKRVNLGPLSFIQIEPGVAFSYANLAEDAHGNESASSLAITVIPPGNPLTSRQCDQPPVLP